MQPFLRPEKAAADFTRIEKLRSVRQGSAGLSERKLVPVEGRDAGGWKIRQLAPMGRRKHWNSGR